jgi:hypothetical protein
MSRGVAWPVALTGSDQTVASGPTLYRGYTVRETAGAAAVLRVYDNTANSGTLLDTISLAASGSASALYDPALRADLGIRVDVVSGAVEGSIRVG